MPTPVGIIGIGTYFPTKIETTADLVKPTGIPADILLHKMGIRQRHIAGPEDTISAMASRAAQRAISQAGISPEQINLVISHGSEYKDHLVWNSAAKIQQQVGAVNAYGFEVYALCAGAPIALNVACSMMQADASLQYVLLAAASRENDLINPGNPRARFMYNFGAGAGAMVLERGANRNQVLGAAAFTDGTLSETVIITREPDAIGSQPTIRGDLYGMLDVQNADYMADRLGETSLASFVRVITEAVQKSGAGLDEVKFLALVHMKRSFFDQVLESIGLTPDQSVYLENHGHIQSVDQALAIELGLQQGKIKPGDLIVLCGAGTGYTWSAIAVRWGED